MSKQMMKELSARNVSANPRTLMSLGEAAMRQDHFPLAYTIAGAGLAQGAENQARFLFLRARSLPPWEEARRSSCLAAAADLARRRHDSDLLKQIGAWRDESLGWMDTPEKAEAALGTDEIGRVVEREINERALPTSRPKLTDPDDYCDCPQCSAERGELPPELMEMVEELGPEVVAQALADMLGIGGKKKRGRRHSRLDDLDMPF
jgi:hypothetical protein